MPVLKVKKNGVWEEVVGISEHTHKISDITDFPTSLPADGGNADTLDGKHADEFALSDDLASVATSGDYDDLVNKPTIPSIESLATTAYVDEKIASVGGSSEGGASVQADWNTMQNKPFGEETVMETLLEENTYEGFAPDPVFGGYAITLMPSPFELSVGETYIVSWGDNVHYVTAKDASVLMEGAVYMGNGSHLQGLEGNNEPFLIGVINGNMMLMDVESTDASHKISIVKEVSVVTPIDPKYLPMDAIDARIEQYVDQYIGEALGGIY